MYNAGAFLAGAIIAVMVSCNGMLQAAVGDWTAVVIIHIIGLATIGLVVGFRRKRLHLIERSRPSSTRRACWACSPRSSTTCATRPSAQR